MNLVELNALKRFRGMIDRGEDLAEFARCCGEGLCIDDSFVTDLISAEIDDAGCVTLAKGKQFPVSFGEIGVPYSNKVLSRTCTQHLLEIFEWIIAGNAVEGLQRKGLLITGLPGDGKVSD